MQSGAIKKNQISASSKHADNCEANQGRLYLTDGTNNKQGAWCAGGNDKTPWLEIDLLKDLAVTGVATQGRNGNGHWVTEYKLQYSYDGTNFQYYKEGGRNTDKVK